jgi:hypothetical protein
MLVHILISYTFAHLLKRKSGVNIMKKILFVILAAVLSGIVSSCTTNQHCAAYGEKQRYQMERR